MFRLGVMDVTYTRTSFLLSFGWNLTLKLVVVTSPGYFLSSRFSWSSSSPSDEVYDGAIYSTWRKVKHVTKVSPGKRHCVWLMAQQYHSFYFSMSVFCHSDVISVSVISTSSWSSSLTPLGLVKSSGPSHSGWLWPWDKVAPMSCEDEDEEDGGSGGWMPSLLVFFMLRSKVPFSSTSMSDSYRVHIYS